MAGSKVDIEGVAELQRAIKAMQTALPKETQKAARKVAQDWVSAGKNKASGRASEVARAMTTRVTPDGASISNSHVLFYGEEFGGGSKPTTQQFPPYRGQRGYFLFPAARENADKFARIWEAGIDEGTKAWNRKG